MIKIVADTTCSLPRSIVEQYSIELIPVYITLNDKTYRDYEELSASDFYKQLNARNLPTTLQPSVDDFKKLYGRILERTPGSTIVSIHVSSALSGTYASAQAAAAAFPADTIRVIDTRSVGSGHGLMVREAAEVACNGGDVAAVQAGLHEVRASMKGYLMLDTLEYVAKSGRIGRAARVLGGLLNVKPVLTMAEGHIEPYKRCRNRKEALEVLVSLTVEAFQPHQRFHLGVMHTGCADEAAVLAGKVREEVEPEVMMMSELSGAVGTFFGPGALGVSWCSLPKAAAV